MFRIKFSPSQAIGRLQAAELHFILLRAGHQHDFPENLVRMGGAHRRALQRTPLPARRADCRDSFVAATVLIDRNEIVKLEGRKQLPGMSSEAMIRTGARTVLSYLAEPITQNPRAMREK
ncbi:hypothetical protein [Mesorhizobium sp. 43Arga]